METKHSMHPGVILKRELQERGITQRQFANRIRVQPSNMSDFIHGRRNLTEDWAIKFEKELGIPFSFWMNLQNQYTYNEKILKEMYSQKPWETEAWGEMMSGRPYNAIDPVLIRELTRVKGLVADYNSTSPLDADILYEKICDIIGRHGKKITINQPFHCDYGRNIHVGENFFANFNLTILDEALVTIGDNAFIGPNVSIYTACHPLDPQERNKGIEWSEAVTIGDNCWLGGGVSILPGITIGDNVTVGAGSVVTKDIPSNEVWAGNPAKKIKSLH